MAFAADSHAAEIMAPEAGDLEEADLVGGFLQNVQDWSDLWAELDAAARLRAEVSLTEELKQLRDAGFIVYCGRRQDTIEGGVSGPSPWRVSILGVFRPDDPRLSSSGANERAAAENLAPDQEYWRDQIVSLAYPLIGQVETYANFEIDSEIRGAVARYARTMRGAVKGKFRELAVGLPSDDEEEHVLRSGSRADLIDLLKKYARLFD
jgi:hypothetical protein